jgi:glutamate/tyrosine decarboxylase-like PLP-dependent enzyme
MKTQTRERARNVSDDVLTLAAERARRYVREISARRVAPGPDDVAALAKFQEGFPDTASDPQDVVRMLDELGSPATVATTGGRYFGFVVGGVLPAAMGANWLASAWDQPAGMRVQGAWVHVDGAFGLWAGVSPKFRHLTQGFELADSWATDAHKWPNVNYDSGIVIVRDGAALRASMTLSAAYLAPGARREPMHHTPEASRRARGVDLWAALKSLGRSGLCELIERTCSLAKRFENGLLAAGFQVLNEVVINQVLVSFGDAETTREVIRRIQEDGTCWCGATEWQGKTAMRISVSSWATTEADVDRSLEVMMRIARECGA